MFFNLLDGVITQDLIISIFLIYVGVVSVLAFLLYGIDKFKAKNHGYRIPEKVLIAFALLGGAIGAILGRSVFRHKTRSEHWYFAFFNVVGLVICIAVFALLRFFIKI